jgi:hypothetical protein
MLRMCVGRPVQASLVKVTCRAHQGQHRVNVRGSSSAGAVTGTRNSAIQGDGKSGPESAYSLLSVVDRLCGAPVARVTVIR